MYLAALSLRFSLCSVAFALWRPACWQRSPQLLHTSLFSSSVQHPEPPLTMNCPPPPPPPYIVRSPGWPVFYFVNLLFPQVLFLHFTFTLLTTYVCRPFQPVCSKSTASASVPVPVQMESWFRAHAKKNREHRKTAAQFTFMTHSGYHVWSVDRTVDKFKRSM